MVTYPLQTDRLTTFARILFSLLLIYCSFLFYLVKSIHHEVFWLSLGPATLLKRDPGTFVFL